MNRRSWMNLRVFMNRFHPKAQDALIKLLPLDEKKALLSDDITSADLSPLLQPTQDALAKIHYSWIKDALKSIPDFWKPFAISSLNPEQIQGLQKTPPRAVSPFVKSFMNTQLYTLLKINERLPIEYLPETEFFSLLNKTKSELLELIDYLGLHDLAFEVRHIVNRNDLKNIYTCLNPKQFYYLKMCLHQKDKIVTPKLGLDPAHFDRKKLKQLLHLRGLSRLGRSLCGQSYDFVWALAHKLDSGRGNILLKDYKPEIEPKITLLLKQQVLNLMNFLKSE